MLHSLPHAHAWLPHSGYCPAASLACIHAMLRADGWTRGRGSKACLRAEPAVHACALPCTRMHYSWPNAAACLRAPHAPPCTTHP
jgi:hypothetical protein